MQDLIQILQTGRDLTSAEVGYAVEQLIAPDADATGKADFLRALREKGESAMEIAAFARAMLALAVDPGLVAGDLPGPILDVCGTGGDQLDLFNVSTTSMFILAAGGVCVVKHGNRAITSQCGGADVLEELGVVIDLPPEDLRACVQQLGLGFIFAPAYHPAFRAIGPVRKALAAQGIPTVFNLLGPLLNPARPAHQVVGIFSPVILPKYAETLAALDRARAWAVHGSGMDEISLCGPTAVHEVKAGVIREFTITPEEFGLKSCSVEYLRGGERPVNAGILFDILRGVDESRRRDLVLLNAAAGFVVAGVVETMEAGLELGREQIRSGAAHRKLRALREFRPKSAA